jgi:RNA polymerase sigma factor (TIGR02999 family)
MMENPPITHSTEHADELSSEQLLPLVYDELRRLAASRMARESAGMTMQPTALVHEAWLRLTGKGDRNWSNRVHFFRAAALAMRRILVERARQKASLKGGGIRVDLDPSLIESDEITADDRLLLIDESLQRLEKEDPESARIILLKFFAGLTNNEVAADLDVNVRTVERQWAYAKASLVRIIREIESKSGNPHLF